MNQPLNALRNEMQRQGMPWYRIEAASGLGTDTVRFWFNGRNKPTVEALNSALDTVGLELRAVPKEAPSE